jgi:hypothetical protein
MSGTLLTRHGDGTVLYGCQDLGITTYTDPAVVPGQLMATQAGIVTIPPMPLPGPRYGDGYVSPTTEGT